MSQPSIEENIDYIINYNLYFAPKKQLYQYLHQIALATNKTEVADVYMNAISELSPDNASEHTIPQHVESDLLESIIEVTKKFEKYKKAKLAVKMGIYLRTTEFKALDDAPSTWFKSLKESSTPKDNGAMQALVICALVSGNPEVIKFALKENYNPNAPLILEDFSALLLAAERGHTECVKALLAAGADIKAQNKYGKTPLMYAAAEGQTECVKALLAAKAEVNAKEKDGQTALMIAAREGHAECVKLLLAAGADINAQDKDGKTALMKAAERGHTECVKLLLEAKAEVNAKEKDGWTALMFAAIKGRTKCVKTLLEAGADWQLKTHKGNRAVDLVVQNLSKNNKTTNDEIYDILYDLARNLSNKQNFWNKCYSFTNIVIAVIFVAWVSISIWKKWSINGSGIDITLYIIGCLVPLIFKAYLSYRANIYRPDNRNACIAYGVTDFFCAMALCLPAISNKILDSFSGVVWLSMLVQLAIAVFLGNRAYKMRYDILYDLSPRTICVWNVIITITLFYLCGGVLTGGYNFGDNLLAALTLGY